MKVIITGVAGFIGGHAARRFLAQGATVIGIDNLSRRGNTENLGELRQLPGDFTFTFGDIRNMNDILRIFATHEDADVVIHLAGQVAVTTSVINPRMDFEANALGTFNLLEATRQHCPGATFLYSSTNKVYGGMEQVEIVETDARYEYRDIPEGIVEGAPLDFHSPYGCSKGTGDQYVHDYARIYGLKTVVFRQSCIYGTHQFGIEDQGWVAWFTIATILGKPITLYGDGKQMRDVLWVDDLIDLYQAAIEKIEIATGKVYNAGGGLVNTMSLRELLAFLEELAEHPIRPAQADWRPGDQKVFVADCTRARTELGWSPKTSPREGVKRLWSWTRPNRALLEKVLG
ncbi:GDP-mannose 4,6-dehydratase [Armatimonas sp.]|uniref:GDP-mannose 4,6-dehydratase n=1 Tax=Armatimonas sp. TaxID=1872638 RepID=UPI00374D658A